MCHQNLSVALLIRALEFSLLFSDLHDNIPSSSSWAIGKSGQTYQAINQDFDSMTKVAQQAAVVKNTSWAELFQDQPSISQLPIR